MRRSAVLLAALLSSACAPHSTPAAMTAPPAAQPAIPPFGLYLNYMDATAGPGDDFFNYANGGWLKTIQMPEDRSYAGINYELDVGNEARLKGLVAELATKPDSALSPEEQKLRDLDVAFLDQTKIEADGMTPAKADLDRLQALKTRDDVAHAMADIPLGLDGPFALGINPDQKHPTSYAAGLGQSGLGMPDRDYYLKTDKDIAATQAAYKTFLQQMLTLAGVPNAPARSAAVYNLELAIAKVSWAADERRDQDKTYNPMTIGELVKFAPQFPWRTAFGELGIPLTNAKGDRVVIVAEKSAIPKLAAVFAKTAVPVWRDYLTVRYMSHFAAELPKAVDLANFAFYGTALSGNSKQLDRTTRAANLLDGTMGEALGHIYVAKYFPPEAKTKIRELVDNLLKAYSEDIKTLDWMGPETRAKAQEKLDKITVKVGYPDRWRDYSALEIPKGQLIQAIKNTTAFEWHRNLVRIDDPVDKTEWGMTPPTNNAYYNPTYNEIVFPAGILQPPNFDANADDAANYGAIGAVIGHEISHGFDDQGAKFDADGVLQNWWTASDAQNFKARTTALGGQYDQFEPLPGLHVNGKLTMGENIADLAGLTIAYKAYHIALGGKPAPVLNGLTGDQRFYIAYGQEWREKWKDGLIRRVVLSDPHTPSKFRVIGATRNMDTWYAAFPDIKPGDKYYLDPKQRVHLW